MDANKSAVLIALITSVTTIIIALIGIWKTSAVGKAVAAGNAVTESVHTIANGRTEALMRELAEKNTEIQRLSLLVPTQTPAPPSVE